jgi:carbon-monoxide dehydrogenase medium subunit
MKPARFVYERPTDVESAIRLLDSMEGAKLIAGGQSLGPMLNLRVVTPSVLVDISRIEELHGIEDKGDEIVIGAGIRHADFEDGRVPSPVPGLFPRVAAGIAYRAVRNRGTVGGSLAHADPAADWPAVMFALGAVLSVRSPNGIRTVPVSELATGALETCLAINEIIESISIRRFSNRARFGRYKVNKKPGDFAEATAIVVIDPQLDDTRVVISGGRIMPEALPKTAVAVAARVRGQSVDLEAAVATELSERGLSSYEHRLFKASILRAAKEAIEG